MYILKEWEYGKNNGDQPSNWLCDQRRVSTETYDTIRISGNRRFYTTFDFVLCDWEYTAAIIDILTHICLTLEINMNQILLIPEFHNPHRIVKEKDELEYMALLDGLNACGKKDFIQTAKQIRKLIK